MGQESSKTRDEMVLIERKRVAAAKKREKDSEKRERERIRQQVSERSERALWKTSILAMKSSKLLRTATSNY